jgi:hypothetical protein
VGVLAAPLPAGAAPAAQDGLTVSVATNATCAQAIFAISVEGGTAPYELTVDFGDGETLIVTAEGLPPSMLTHTYAAGGEYVWSVTAVSGLLSGRRAGRWHRRPSRSAIRFPRCSRWLKEGLR